MEVDDEPSSRGVECVLLEHLREICARGTMKSTVPEVHMTAVTVRLIPKLPTVRESGSTPKCSIHLLGRAPGPLPHPTRPVA